jgi:hypothetical protein
MTGADLINLLASLIEEHSKIELFAAKVWYLPIRLIAACSFQCALGELEPRINRFPSNAMP